jgi:Protein of unknown function (DUF3168)
VLKTSLWPVQKAIYERLSTDDALMQKINGVYDEVPENIEDDSGESVKVEKPYIVIGEPTMNPFETKSSFGEDIVFVLHTWSDYPGKKETYEILNLMLQAITKRPYVIEGFSLVRVKIEPNMQVLTDIDNVTKHGILRVRFTINN